MRKSVIILIAIVVLGLGGLWASNQDRGVTLGKLELGGWETKWLADRSFDFFEDLQFKDFDTASTYHLPETQAKRDIPKMIQRRFGIKHEMLDILSYEVMEVDLDRSKARARVRCLVRYRVLGDGAIRDNKETRRNLEMLLYWFRGEGPEPKWYMELESSL